MHPAPSLVELPPTSRAGRKNPNRARPDGNDTQSEYPGLSDPDDSDDPKPPIPMRRYSISSTESVAATSLVSGNTAAASFSVEDRPTFASQSIFSVKDGSNIANNRRVNRRRTGPLSVEQREKAAIIRKLGACHDCRRRRVACNPLHHNMTWDDAIRKYKSDDSAIPAKAKQADVTKAVEEMPRQNTGDASLLSPFIFSETKVSSRIGDIDTEIDSFPEHGKQGKIYPRTPLPTGPTTLFREAPSDELHPNNEIPLMDAQKHKRQTGFSRSPMTLDDPSMGILTDYSPDTNITTSSSPRLASRENASPLRPGREEADNIIHMDAVLGPLTDSGYASARYKAVPPNIHIEAPSNRMFSAPMPDMNPAEDSMLNHNETATIYSDEGSIHGAELFAYKSELADSLVNKVRQLGSSLEIAADLAVNLPSLLKEFALKLGQHGSTKAERDVMYFVHKYRHDISRQFHTTILGISEEDSISSRGPSDKVSTEVTSSRIKEWLSDLGHCDKDDVSQNVSQHASLQTTFQDDEEIILPDRHGYRQVVFGSGAYKWLVSSLSQEIFLGSPPGTTAMHNIKSMVLQSLPVSQHVSRHIESETYNTTFLAELDLISFLHAEYGAMLDVTQVDSIAKVITVTGSASHAQALPCSGYVEQTWPWSGQYILSALHEALKTSAPATRRLPDRSTICVALGKQSGEECLEVKVNGTADFVAEVGEAIGWLTAALRSSSDECCMATCTSSISHIDQLGVGSLRFNIEVNLELETEEAGLDKNGSCWRGLFRNAVIVAGYPTPRRTQGNTGIEMPLDMAAALADAKHLQNFMGQLYLKGFCTVLAPVAVSGGVVLWHLFYNAEGKRVPYLDASIPKREDIDVQVLRTSRHVIGWCSDALYMAGDAASNYDIGGSLLPVPSRDFSLEKISFSVGQIVTGGCQFAIGRKDIPIHITKQGYISKLRWVEQKYVIFWDEEEKRAWLVKGTSALLHLLRASLEHCRTDKFSSEFIFDLKTFEEAARPCRNDSAIEVLLNPRNRKLRLYPLSEESYDETFIRPDGKQEKITKTITTYSTIEDRVVELFETLEKLIDHEASSGASSKGLTVKPSLRSRIEGWDFTDISTNRDPIYLRIAALPGLTRTWVDFSKSIHAVVLFGRGFGDLIKPTGTTRDQPESSQTWLSMPKEKGFLAASVADLKNIIAVMGDQTTRPLTLAPGILWHNPSARSPFADGHDSSPLQSRPSPVQELFPDNFMFRRLFQGKEPMNLEDSQNGAVIFGSHKSNWHWPELGDPVEHKNIVASDSGSSEISLPTVQKSSSNDSNEPSMDWSQDSVDTCQTSPIVSRSQSQPEKNNSDSCSGPSSNESLVESDMDVVSNGHVKATTVHNNNTLKRGAPPLHDGDESLEERDSKRQKLLDMVSRTKRRVLKDSRRSSRDPDSSIL